MCLKEFRRYDRICYHSSIQKKTLGKFMYKTKLSSSNFHAIFIFLAQPFENRALIQRAKMFSNISMRQFPEHRWRISFDNILTKHLIHIKDSAQRIKPGCLCISDQEFVDESCHWLAPKSKKFAFLLTEINCLSEFV